MENAVQKTVDIVDIVDKNENTRGQAQSLSTTIKQISTDKKRKK